MLRNWAVIFIGCLILGFQNCGRQGLLSVSKSDVGAEMSNTESSSSPVTAVEIPTDNGSLMVQADSGKIALVDSTNQIVEEGCLSDKDLQDLQSYTKSYNLCGSTTKINAGTVCTAVYKRGYASLIIDGQKMNLGESFDGCGSGFRDFCGAQAQSFRGLVDYIANNFPSMKCQ
ncbi:MAG TPA: hypothetical protein VN132_04950 [Bdellovibrio sp.]|nr:hypothetical protein [Bdellovibrio sp.]